MTKIIDFEKAKKYSLADATTESFIYYVVCQKVTNGVVSGYTATMISDDFNMNVKTLANIRNKTLQLLKEVDKYITDVTIMNVIPLGIETLDNNSNTWKEIIKNDE